MRRKQTKQANTANLAPSKFVVNLANIRGLHSNLSAVQHHLGTDSPDLLFLTETQIKNPADVSYLAIPGYTLEDKFLPRAGVCLYVRSGTCCLRLRALEDPELSAMWVHVDLGSQTRVYACIYRSHSGDSETARLFAHLSAAAEAAQCRFPSAELVFLGDFNAHHKDWLGFSRDIDFAGREAYSFSLEYGLTQLVNSPTRIPDVAGHNESLLDLLLTSDPTGYVVSVEAPLGSSDHCLVRASVPRIPPQRQPVRRRTRWHYKSADWDEMRLFFSSYPWKQVCFGSDDPSHCADAVSDVIKQGIELFIPKSFGYIGGKHKPWFSNDCHQALSCKVAAYKSWTRAKVEGLPNISELRHDYNVASRSYKRVLNRAKLEHVRGIGQRLTEYPTGSREFWSLAKAVESNFCRSTLPPLKRDDGSLVFSSKEKAELLGTLFAANSTLDDQGQAPPPSSRCSSSLPKISFRLQSVRRELRGLDIHKASGPDEIPSVVLKVCAAELSPVLTRLYRLSYAKGIVPGSWKNANVQPVPKKGDRSDPANYRPIAITSQLCKVMERIINIQLLAYLEGNDLLSDNQYGFRSNRSAGDLLAYATHLWGDAMENHGEALAVSLDIAKAFDRVWHKALLAKLPSFGLPPELCRWIADFLSNRSIQVNVDGFCSGRNSINAGVPQGSVLSPTLFLMFINDLLGLGDILCYADDSTVVARYKCRANTSGRDIDRYRRELVSSINSTLDRISSWGRKNLVSFNTGKTQVCAFSAKREGFEPAPQFQGVYLPISDHLELLGVDLSHDLNFRAHIEAKAKLSSKKLGVLNKVREYFRPDLRLLLYKTQVRSCMEYCSHLWDGSAQYQLAALDRIERRAVRLVGDRSVSNTLEPLQLRRDIGSLSVFYRLYHGDCADGLFGVMPVAPFHRRTTRRRLALHPHTVSRVTMRTVRFGRSFVNRVSKRWNALPASVFPIERNLGSFKRNLKKHLSGGRVSGGAHPSGVHGRR